MNVHERLTLIVGETLVSRPFSNNHQSRSDCPN
jgi:hypothetical protein